jgi:hypothetical protein
MDGRQWWVLAERCFSAVCETDHYGYLVAAVRLRHFPHISFFLVFFLLCRLGFVLLIISPWPTFQIQKFKKVRFRNSVEQMPAL